MIANLNPCDAHIDENLTTLLYAGKAAVIANKPIRGDDPKTRQIEDLKQQVKMLTEELIKANETIQFLSSITGQNPDLVKANLHGINNSRQHTPPRNDGRPPIARQDSAVT